MMDLSYLKNIMNYIYDCKMTIQEIHVLIFLQLDLLLKGTSIFQSIKCFNAAPAQLCEPIFDYALKNELLKGCIR